MKKIVVFNWKSNPRAAVSAVKLARAVEKAVSGKRTEVVVAPPFIFLEDVGKIIKKTKLGAQDVFWGDVGPYTGEISWHQEKNLKVKYAIIGHSERRKILGETDEMVNKKVLAALKAGLKVILCVGEPLAIREKGEKAVKNFIKSQLRKDLKGVRNSLFKIHNSLIVAYEPIWAIGAGLADTPEDAVEVIKFIKSVFDSGFKILNYRILYGGSVTGKNIKDFVKYKEIGGFLVGHASLDRKEVGKIIKTAYENQKL